jgi:hypothetical protein
MFPWGKVLFLLYTVRCVICRGGGGVRISNWNQSAAYRQMYCVLLSLQRFIAADVRLLAAIGAGTVLACAFHSARGEKRASSL